MERRSFLKKLGLAGVVAAPVAAAPVAAVAAEKPITKPDIFGRKPLKIWTPEALLDNWYDRAFNGSPEILMQAMVTDEFCKLVPDAHLRLTTEDVRAALKDTNIRAHRLVTPRFFIDLYDNQSRPPHDIAAVPVPLATEPMRHYIGGSNSVIGRIKSALLEGVRDLVREVKDSFPGTAVAAPEIHVDRQGPILNFYLYTHVLQPVPPRPMAEEGRVA